ncbi:MAG: copper resistance protein CopD [Flavobacterium sp.]|nr:MAG: copper resistance protein CopD [Flavobacterium sp.]
MNHHLLLAIHIVAASVWVGGHLLLAVKYLPKALRERNVQIILNFEKGYESLGMPSLLLLVATGIAMAYDYGVPVSHWFSFSDPIEKVVSTKLVLLLSTLALAINAQLFVIPKLSEKNLKLMAVHIVLVTLLGVSMLILGTFVRYGGI